MRETGVTASRRAVGFLVLISALLVTDPAAASQVPEVEYRKLAFASIGATVNGAEYVVSDLEVDNPYLADRLDIEYVGDWDNNGIQDLIFGAINGGNDRDYTYVFATYVPGVGIKTYPLMDSHFTPKLEEMLVEGETRWVITGYENNEGMHRADFHQVRRRFVIEDGKPRQIEETVDEEIPALVEYRTHQAVDSIPEGDFIQYDLDNNGKLDRITGSYWGRWGRISVEVIWDDGRKTTDIGNCKRIGVLDSKHSGVHNLVCDNSHKIIWVDGRYEKQPDRFGLQ